MKIVGELKTISYSAGFLLMMIVMAIAIGCSRNREGRLSANVPAPYGVWKLVPGDRLTYRLNYASDSFTDLQALYGSMGAVSQRAPQPIAPRRFQVTLDAITVITAIQQNGPTTIAGYRFVDARIKVDGELGAMIDNDRVQADLALDTVCEMDAEGRIRSLVFDPDITPASANFVRSLLGLIQFARPEGAEANWEIDEDDLSGDYRAQYSEITATKTGTQSIQPGTASVFRKTKLGYYPPVIDDGRQLSELPKTTQTDAQFEVAFDWSKGRIESISGAETQTVSIANKVVGGAQNRIQLKLLNEESAPPEEIASSVENSFKRRVSMPPVGLSTPPSEQERFTAIYRAQLGDDSLGTIKAALDAPELGYGQYSYSELYSKVKALSFLEPEACVEFGTILSSRTNITTAKLLAGALSAIGNDAAQQALIGALRVRRDDEFIGSLVISALCGLKNPTQSAQDAVEEIAWRSANSPLANTAQLQLGIMAYHLKKRSPQRAAAIIERAAKELSTLPGAERRLIALLGNSGVDNALYVLSQFLDHPSADLRSESILALRFQDGTHADEILARALTSDNDESVRMQAANAMEFRMTTQTNFDAQKNVLLSNKNNNALRIKVMRNLWRSRDNYPNVIDLIKTIASRDSSVEVRKEASRLCSIL